MQRTISREQLARALKLRDLTNPLTGAHAMQLLLRELVQAVADRMDAATIVHRTHPVVTIHENYDRLGYPADGAARDARYSRYVADDALLRTHTSAMIPRLLADIARHQLVGPLLLVCPGLVYRRDSIDRWHVGEPHQVDLWLLARKPLGDHDLDSMVEAAVEAVLPGAWHRSVPADHPYTARGRQIDVYRGQEWVEIAECGLAGRSVLAESGLDPDTVSGLAMGLGLDRLVMLRKGVNDIRLLRSQDRRVAEQMLDLSPYRPVSHHPAMSRHLSVAMRAEVDEESVGDRIRETLGPDDHMVEAIKIRDETAYADLPDAARSRMGIAPDQKNVLIEIVLRHMTRSLTADEANALRDRVYLALHEGAVRELIDPAIKE